MLMLSNTNYQYYCLITFYYLIVIKRDTRSIQPVVWRLYRSRPSCWSVAVLCIWTYLNLWLWHLALKLHHGNVITRSADAHNGLDAFSGQSRSTNMVPFHMLHVVSYCAIVTLSLRYSSSKNFMTLKWGSNVTQGHWEWYHSIDCVWFPISVL